MRSSAASLPRFESQLYNVLAIRLSTNSLRFSVPPFLPHLQIASLIEVCAIIITILQINKWGSELSNVPKVTQLISKGAGIWTQAA